MDNFEFNDIDTAWEIMKMHTYNRRLVSFEAIIGKPIGLSRSQTELLFELSRLTTTHGNLSDNVFRMQGAWIKRSKYSNVTNAERVEILERDHKARFYAEYDRYCAEYTKAIVPIMAIIDGIIQDTPDREGYTRLYRTAYEDYELWPRTFWSERIRVASDFAGLKWRGYDTMYTVNVPTEDLAAAAEDNSEIGEEAIPFDKYTGKYNWVIRQSGYDVVPLSERAIERTIDFGSIEWDNDLVYQS